MIRKFCAMAADGDRCPWCERPITRMADGAFWKHASGRGEPTCVGYGAQPQEGHALCRGCDCHHDPVVTR